MSASPAVTVLIVDDNEKNRKLARDILQFAGFDTVEAATAEEAITSALRYIPALVLLDIRLPDLDGVSALGRLRADPRTASIPVVALTAYAMSGDRESFLDAGFSGYLEKPIHVATFADEVRHFCHRPGPVGQ
jgi:two-component system cell cycle response regulator DivK